MITFIFLVYLKEIGGSSILLPKLYFPMNQGNQSPSQPCEARECFGWRQPKQVASHGPRKGEQPWLPVCGPSRNLWRVLSG